MRLRRGTDAYALRAAQDTGHAEDADRRFRGRVLGVRPVARRRAVRPRGPPVRGRPSGARVPLSGGRVSGGRHRARLFRVRHVRAGRARPSARAARRPVRRPPLRGPRQSVRPGPETVVDRREAPRTERQRAAGLRAAFGGPPGERRRVTTVKIVASSAVPSADQSVQIVLNEFLFFFYCYVHNNIILYCVTKKIKSNLVLKSHGRTIYGLFRSITTRVGIIINISIIKILYRSIS